MFLGWSVLARKRLQTKRGTPSSPSDSCFQGWGDKPWRRFASAAAVSAIRPKTTFRKLVSQLFVQYRFLENYIYTDSGAPRGQVHYFADTSSAKANAPLNRLDLEQLVDLLAIEMDQDYYCTLRAAEALPRIQEPALAYIIV